DRRELNDPPLQAPVTKYEGTVTKLAAVGGAVDEALRLASQPHRGPVFLDVPMDQLFSRAEAAVPQGPNDVRTEPDPDDLGKIAELLGQATRPVLVIGSGVWADASEDAALRLAETLQIPVI